MELSLTKEQEMLKDVARSFLEKECPRELVRRMEEDERGYSPELWKKMAELGWMGLPFPEEYGGTGGDFVDLVILIGEMGRVLLPAPFIPTVVSGGISVFKYGSETQKKEILPKISSGELITTFAFTEPSLSLEEEKLETRAERVGENFSLRGTKLFVQDAHVSDLILCPARTEEGTALFMLGNPREGLKITPLKMLSGEKYCEVILEGVPASEKDVLGEIGEGWGITEASRLFTTTALCAYVNGAARKVLEMSVEYAKERVQFGRQIGSFQAVAHKCSDMVIAIDASDYLTWRASWKLAKDMPARMDVSMAKAWVSDVLKRVWMEGIRVHGGVAIMEDHDMPLYFRRGKIWELFLGDGDYHWEVVARELGL